MVLSNKKLKQKLRAEKAELLAASEAQIGASGNNFKNPGDPNLKSLQSLKPIESVAQEPRSSKKGKRKKKAPSLQENEIGDGGGNEKQENVEEGSEKVGEDDKKTKKRKRAEGNQGLEDGKVNTPKKLKKKKKKKKKRKGEKKVDDGKVKEGLLSVDDAKIDGQGVTESANTGISEGTTGVSTKVYAGGIPYYSTEDDIRSYFESCGTITDIDCMKFPESGKFRGIAIMNFKTEAAAKRALALDGSDMGGFFLKIQPYKPTRPDKTTKFTPTMVEGYNRIYAGNLSWDITEEDLRALFSGCSIASIRFGEDKETGEFRGYAHVDFSDSISLNLALKLDQKIVCGRPVRISSAVPKKGSDNKMRSVPEEKEVVPEKKEAAVPEKNEATIPEMNEAVDDGVTTISGKIRRRTCYECGERGHLSSSCPNPKKQAVDQTNPVDDVVPAAVDHRNPLDDVVPASSGKIRRRTCYECGERGHLSSSCPNPKKQAVDQTNPVDDGVPAISEKKQAVDQTNPVDDGVPAISGKIRRRTCYECGERGRLSSSCPNPKKQAVEQTNPTTS